MANSVPYKMQPAANVNSNDDRNETAAIELTMVSSSLENIDSRLPDVVVETRIYEAAAENKETYFSIAIQVFIPFLIAGFGMVGAGLVLDVVQVKLHGYEVRL